MEDIIWVHKQTGNVHHVFRWGQKCDDALQHQIQPSNGLLQKFKGWGKCRTEWIRVILRKRCHLWPFDLILMLLTGYRTKSHYFIDILWLVVYYSKQLHSLHSPYFKNIDLKKLMISLICVIYLFTYFRGLYQCLVMLNILALLWEKMIMITFSLVKYLLNTSVVCWNDS